MNITRAELEAMAAWPSQYPEGNVPEFAFAGRSNVGKSSFINAMAKRKKLAYTSSKPGKTRTVNFYRIEELRFVDLPGYGYAKVSKKERESWAPVINTYLESREELLEVFLLVDGRHAPSAQDQEMFQWMRDSGFSGLVIATKVDKLSRNEWAKNRRLIAKTLDIDEEQILPFSTERKDLQEEMWWTLRDIVRHYSEE